MNFTLFATYIFTISIIIVIPGPNALLMVSHSINYGKNAAIKNALGGVSGALFLIILVLLGMVAFIPNTAMPWLSIAGSGYLGWIAYKTITSKEDASENHGVVILKNKKNFYLESLLTGLSNPKDLIFFVLFLPQFIDKNLEPYQAFILLIFGWLVCDLSIMLLYGIFAIRAKSFFVGNKISILKKVIGFLIGAIGFGLLFSALKSLQIGFL
jgi:homoserine/homoserine lactone efflux protein